MSDLDKCALEAAAEVMQEIASCGDENCASCRASAANVITAYLAAIAVKPSDLQTVLAYDAGYEAGALAMRERAVKELTADNEHTAAGYVADLPVTP